MRIKIIFLSLFMLSACDVPEPLENAIESAKKLMGMAFQQDNKPTPSATPALTPEQATLKANSEIIAEMIKVTFNEKEIVDQSLFLSLVSSLNQGASLEGVYRGLVMGSHYRVVESKSQAATPDAIKFFASEMAELQSGMKNPTRFIKDTAKQIPNIEYPEGISENSNEEIQVPVKMNKSQIAEELLQDFIGATPFTLKRVMAEEILKKFDEMKDSAADMAQWYAGLVVHLSGAHTDYGLPQRNSSDFDFHSRFAKTMSIDRVKWEMLNRYHRIINRLN